MQNILKNFKFTEKNIKCPHIQKGVQRWSREIHVGLLYACMRFGGLNMQYWSNAALSFWTENKWSINSAS